MPKGLTYIPVVPLEVAIFTYLMPQKGTLNLIAPKKTHGFGKVWDLGFQTNGIQQQNPKCRGSLKYYTPPKTDM